jgi:mono/diheme cytochrome c family protein
MHNTVRRTRRASIALAMVLLSSSLARLTAAGNPDAGQPREWKAPRSVAARRNPIAADERSLAVGKAVYARECASCHGDDGRGNGAEAANLSRQPADFASSAVSNESDGELFWKITEGKRPMPRYARTLSEDDRWHLVNYVRSIGSASHK